MLIFDTETTGLVLPEIQPLAMQPQVIEYAVLKLDDETLEETDFITSLVHPRTPLPDIITKITGLRDVDFVDAKPFGAHYLPLADFFRGERTVLGHHVQFDMDLLRFELTRLDRLCYFPWPTDRVCTVEATMHVKGHRLKQSELYEHFMGRPLPEAHRALPDTRNLADVVRILRKEKLL